MSKRKPMYPLTTHDKRHHSSSLNHSHPPPRRALLIVDVQNDFCPPSGSLAVPEGHHIVPIINQLRSTQHWDLICLSQDWHPQGHVSFYDTHQNKPNARLFSPITLEDGTEQILWPIHCVQGSEGSMFHPDLKIENTDHIIQKGTHIDVDSYSAFYDNLRRYRTHLSDLLHSHDIQHVYVCGLALDYCVGYTACDSQSEGFITSVIQDATRGVAAASSAAMLDRFRELGINIIQSTDIPTISSTPPSASSLMATTSQDDLWMASSTSSPEILSASSSPSSHFLSPSLSPVSSSTSSPCLSPSPHRFSLGDPESVSDSEGWCSSSSSPEIPQKRIIHTPITSFKLPNAVTTRSVTRSHVGK